MTHQVAACGGLLARLRTETRGAHDALDRAVTGASSRALVPVLRMNLAAFSAMAPALVPGTVAARIVPGLIEALRADLGERPAALPPVAPLDPRAADYVTLGSRLGTRVLRRRWPDARSAYLDLPPEGAAWRALAGALAAAPGDGPEAERTCRDAVRLFALFAAALPADREVAA